MSDDRYPIGAVVTSVVWHSEPDKYSAPADFGSLDDALAHGVAPRVSIRLGLRAPGGTSSEVAGTVSGIDGIRESRYASMTGRPTVGARLVDATPDASTPRELIFSTGTDLFSVYL